VPPRERRLYNTSGFRNLCVISSPGPSDAIAASAASIGSILGELYGVEAGVAFWWGAHYTGPRVPPGTTLVAIHAIVNAHGRGHDPSSLNTRYLH
jgi:hypothetical protein